MPQSTRDSDTNTVAVPAVPGERRCIKRMGLCCPPTIRSSSPQTQLLSPLANVIAQIRIRLPNARNALSFVSDRAVFAHVCSKGFRPVAVALHTTPAPQGRTAARPQPPPLLPP